MYTAQAEVWNADRQLVAAVVADVQTKGDQWRGILTVDAAPIDWFGQNLSLHMDGHPTGPILVERAPTRAVGGVQFVHFLGLGLPPFWDRRLKAELIEELRKRRPVAGALHDESNQQIREVLKDRDGMTGAEIDDAIEALNDA